MQQIKTIADLFPHEDQNLQKSVAKKVLESEGKGVLFVLDGFDELPVSLRNRGFLFRMLQGKVLPKCSLLVTSRPSATKDIYMACSAQIRRHIEILGFTQECVEKYAKSIFSSESILNDFKTYVSASKNPAINSLMYIPLNAAIIVHIYRNGRRKGCPIPKTLTQVYTQLCLTLLQRHIIATDPQNKTTLNNFSDISTPYYIHFQCLSQLAFEQFERESIIFYSDSVPEELVHFGFLDCVPALYCGGGVSYNFLHLTLQEFLAAYHIAQHPSDNDVFKSFSKDRRWEVVWRFVSGLTGFQYFMDSVRCDAFVSVSEEDEYITVENLFLHCLFEGQCMFDYMAVLGNNMIHSRQRAVEGSFSSPMDRYALGYCISHCSSPTSWKVYMSFSSGESFTWGLDSNLHGKGVISHITMISVSPTYLDSAAKYLSGHLRVVDADAEIVQALPRMKNLTSLDLAPKILLDVSVIPLTNIQTLTLRFVLQENQTFLLSLHDLISSPSNMFKNLAIISFGKYNVNTKPLCDVLFGPSSLNQLTLKLPYFSLNSFDLLETNTCLTTVRISSTQLLPPQSLCKILQGNRTIENLRWGECNTLDLQIEAFIMALSSNTTLKELTLHMLPSYITNYVSSLIHDTRVSILHQEFLS